MPTEGNDSARTAEFATSMKRIIYFIVGSVLLIAGFMIGRAYQKAATGYHYNLLERKEYASDLGPIEWTCFMESVGVPFLESEKTMINMGNRTIYKAQRDFQADAPSAENIKTSGNSITWDDGDYFYHLTVEEMKKVQPSGTTNRPASFTHPAVP